MLGDHKGLSTLWSRSNWVCDYDRTSGGNFSTHIREAELAGWVWGLLGEQGLEKPNLDPSELYSSPGWLKKKKGTECEQEF